MSLLQVEPELGAALTDQQREAAEQSLQTPTLSLGVGLWQPQQAESGDGFSYLLIEGMLLRRVVLRGGRSVELLAQGDCLLPWREESASFSRAEWQVVEAARLAVLDLRAGSNLACLPQIASMVAARAIDRSRRLALQSATMSIVGIEERLHALFWALAERWGRVGEKGVELALNVSQDVLAEMVGARRPTVNSALGSLANRGVLIPLGSGQWLLSGDPPLPEPEG